MSKPKRGSKTALALGMGLFLGVSLWGSRSLAGAGRPQGRVIEVLAGHDSRYKIDGQRQPSITVQADELITLRISAKKAKQVNRNGYIHGFTLLRAKDKSPVPEWDFLLKPGTQEFTLAAPHEPGEYVVVCTVVCSLDHEGMSMKFVVVR